MFGIFFSFDELASLFPTAFHGWTTANLPPMSASPGAASAHPPPFGSHPESSRVTYKGSVGYVLSPLRMFRFVFSLPVIILTSLGLAGAVRAAEPFDAFLAK